MPGVRPGEIVFGDSRRNAEGRLEIKASRKWIPYPQEAAELIDMAIAHGWGTDDGLPVRHTMQGEIFIRILIGRERGTNALTGKVVNGLQFHLTWRLRDHEWVSSEGYVNVGTPSWSSWRRTRPEFARKAIAGNPLEFPSAYADEGEYRAC